MEAFHLPLKSLSLSTLIFLLCCVSLTISDGLIYSTREFSRAQSIPDIRKKTPDFIESNGYVSETHEVTTEDGYIITLHRIPQGKKTDTSQKSKHGKPVVLLQHGIAGASDNWVLSGPKAFPYILADKGYDVWLIDTRGNSYSKRHVNLTVADPAYWDFSFHEQGIYDMASSIDYALKVSGQKKLFLMGHSRGSTSSFALLSTRPEYNKKIRLFIAYAPAVYVKHSKSELVQSFFRFTSPRDARVLLKNLQISSLPGLTETNVKVRSSVCGQYSKAEDNICTQLLFMMNGYDYELINKTLIPVMFSHFPDGGGVREFLHFLQIGRTDRFAMYDFGRDNLRIYGSVKPPLYPLRNIYAPVAFYYADNDYVVTKRDVDRIISETRNVAGAFRVPHPKFNHVDFMWGIADDLLYLPTIKLMNKY